MVLEESYLKKILKDAKVDLNKKAKDLTDDELSRIRKRSR